MTGLAAQQLASIATGSSGAVEILDTQQEGDDIQFVVSLDTSGVVTQGGGIRVRERERFTIVVTPRFPFEPPSIQVEHLRWARTPHVQWGRQLCIYAAPSIEWNPAEGMRGLLARLITWIEKAAANKLDPDGQPLHPPVAYPNRSSGVMIVRPDVGAHAPWAVDQVEPGPIFGWCASTPNRLEVLEWLTRAEVLERILADRSDDDARRYVIVPLLLISDQIGFEYPLNAADLAECLAKSGFHARPCSTPCATQPL